MPIIPEFPDSTQLTFDHTEELKPYLSRNRHEISEFSMASLYPFTRKREYRISRYTDAKGETGYLLIGKDKSGERETLFAMFPSGYPGRDLLMAISSSVQEVNTIAEELREEWEEGMKRDNLTFALEEDRDNADYLYDRQSLVDLSGQVLHKKMAHVNRFIKEHPERIILPTTIAPEKDMIEVLDRWAEGKDAVEDYQATLLAIEFREALDLTGYVLYSKDSPIAFTLGEFSSSDTYIVHVEKAITSYRGVYQYINRACVSLLPEEITTVNREQDLGITGLRQAKMTYQPKRLLMKYRITLESKKS